MTGEPYWWNDRWHDTVSWWSDPSLAYIKGLQDGCEMGYAQACENILEGFRSAIGAKPGEDLKAAMAHHVRELDRARARRAAPDAPKKPPRTISARRLDR